jgi:hypothetical protein
MVPLLRFRVCLAVIDMKIVTLFVCSLWVLVAGAAPFQNGGFEMPDSLGVGEEVALGVNDMSVVGWKTGGPAGSVSRIKNGVELWRVWVCFEFGAVRATV